MAKYILTDGEVLEIVYNTDKSLSDSNNDSVCRIDTEIDDIAVADAIINDDSGDEEEILHRNFRWETMDNYTDTEKCSVVILHPEMAQKM